MRAIQPTSLWKGCSAKHVADTHDIPGEGALRGALHLGLELGYDIDPAIPLALSFLSQEVFTMYHLLAGTMLRSNRLRFLGQA